MRHPGLIKTLVCTASLALGGSALAQKTTLLVYTALETDQLKAYQEGFNKVEPNIELKWVRDSTGVITAKLLAEKGNPAADVVMGVAASSLALLDKNGMLEPYKPLNFDALMSQYVDKKNPPAWFGMDVWGATVCFNTVEAQKRGLPKPESWKDMTKPIYKGQIVMPNPASSGTGFFDVTAFAGVPVVLFGSRAGGWARERSDWDIGILGPDDVPGYVMARIRSDLDELPTLHRFDLVDLHSTSDAFQREALKEVRPL